MVEAVQYKAFRATGVTRTRSVVGILCECYPGITRTAGDGRYMLVCKRIIPIFQFPAPTGETKRLRCENVGCRNSQTRRHAEFGRVVWP